MRVKICSSAIVLAVVVSSVAFAQETPNSSTDETEKVKTAIASYIAAYNARDARKLASHWSPDGTYTNRSTGEQTVGREAIAAEFARMFAEEQVPELAVVTESVQLVSPNVALEKGTATVTHSPEEIVKTRYSVVYVENDGRWLIDRVTEEDTGSASSYEQLKELEWLVGDWTLEGGGYQVELSTQWTANRNFISRKFTVSGNQEVETSGLQIIGWDEKDKIIRSWLFDSDGGVVTGKWNRKDDGWSVQSVAKLADGSVGSYTTLFRTIDDDSFGWQKVNRILDSELLPNIDEVIIRRN